jgi:hypothetical protein
MAHFAHLNENNEVDNIIVISNEDIIDENGLESEEIGISLCRKLINDQNSNWKQTSYNNSFRKRYAGIGMQYNEDIDAFIFPKPYESWSLNAETANWESPIPRPQIDEDKKETHMYIWDENILNWVLEPIPTMRMIKNLFN